MWRKNFLAVVGLALLALGLGVMSAQDKKDKAVKTKGEVSSMADTIPAGSDVSAGTYRCTECHETITTASVKSLPPCPKCANGSWEALTGGDAAADPYPGN